MEKNSIVLIIHLVKATPVSNMSCFLPFVAVFVSVVFVVVAFVVFVYFCPNKYVTNFWKIFFHARGQFI